jgi:hypothetical protein
VSRLCVYCGEGFNGGEAAPREISFVATTAYKLLLQSLGLDGSVSEKFVSLLRELLLKSEVCFHLPKMNWAWFEFV